MLRRIATYIGAIVLLYASFPALVLFVWGQLWQTWKEPELTHWCCAPLLHRFSPCYWCFRGFCWLLHQDSTIISFWYRQLRQSV